MQRMCSFILIIIRGMKVGIALVLLSHWWLKRLQGVCWGRRVLLERFLFLFLFCFVFLIIFTLSILTPPFLPQGEGLPEDVGAEAVKKLLCEVMGMGCVDTPTQHFILLYMVLCPAEVSQIKMGQLSPFTMQVCGEESHWYRCAVLICYFLPSLYQNLNQIVHEDVEGFLWGGISSRGGGRRSGVVLCWCWL